MITMLISLAYITGADAVLVGWAVCAAVYFAGCMAFAFNRTDSGLHRVWHYFLTTELLVDLIWALTLYFPDGYVNRGVGTMAVVLLWPAALVIAGAVASAKNHMK